MFDLLFISGKSSSLYPIAGVCRLEGDGAFTDTQGLVWTGKFNGETALGLKLQNGI